MKYNLSLRYADEPDLDVYFYGISYNALFNLEPQAAAIAQAPNFISLEFVIDTRVVRITRA